METRKLYAHTPVSGSRKWHGLREHLEAAADLAGQFAAKFGGEEAARAAGLAHDAAKASPEFQRYLRAAFEGRVLAKVPHAPAGAAASVGRLGFVAAAVYGHHAGMPDKSDMKARLGSADPDSISAARKLLAELGWPESQPVGLPAFCNGAASAELFVRMILSCLVDADRLDTEAHCMEGPNPQRGGHPSVDWYKEKVDARMGLFPAAEAGVSFHRRQILESCRAAAASPPGFFDLQVPTGGGKTLSGLSFALDHAAAHGLERVIVAIPYTSIIDQTARTYKDIFGEDCVLEHHSAVEPQEDEGQSEADVRRRLAAENWDCPLVVTTTVQLFESLHSCRPSRCRKLHRIARSVIILDEVQALPVEFLSPILDMLRELVDHYGCSVVLSTATLPDLSCVKRGLPQRRTALVPDFPRHYQALRRVRYEAREEEWTAERTAAEILSHPRVLAVFNSRADALQAARACQTEGDLLHLSALLCGHHRRKVIEEVRRRLKEGLPVRLVSTQVVEAGVDLDFPVVMRVLGPLDRIIQAAGRCNREGSLPEGGLCIVFRQEGARMPHGSYGLAVQITDALMKRWGGDLDSPEAVQQYSRELFTYTDQDRKDILDLRGRLAFRQVDEQFRMIGSETEACVVASYEGADVRSLIEEWRFRPWGWHRRISPFTVSLYRHDLEKLRDAGAVEKHESGLWICSGKYDSVLGLVEWCRDPADLVA